MEGKNNLGEKHKNLVTLKRGNHPKPTATIVVTGEVAAAPFKVRNHGRCLLLLSCKKTTGHRGRNSTDLTLSQGT